MGNENEYVVKGKQAQEILEELNKPPSQAKIDRLKQALKNRVGKKQNPSRKSIRKS